jgi:uncharacterized membrane protein YhaH (DUF805 family)
VLVEPWAVIDAWCPASSLRPTRALPTRAGSITTSIMELNPSERTGAMSFGEAIQTVFRKYAEFTGRATRAEFWWWALFNLLVAAALNLFNVIRIGENAYLGSLLAGVWGIAVLLPSLAVAVRRLRDAGYGWANLFFILVPIAGIVVLATLWAQPTKTPAPAATA